MFLEDQGRAIHLPLFSFPLHGQDHMVKLSSRAMSRSLNREKQFEKRNLDPDNSEPTDQPWAAYLLVYFMHERT